MFFVFFFWREFHGFCFWMDRWDAIPWKSWPIVTLRPLASTKGSFAPQNLSATQHGTADDSQSFLWSKVTPVMFLSEIWLWLADVVEKKFALSPIWLYSPSQKLWSSQKSARSSPGNLSWSQHPRMAGGFAIIFFVETTVCMLLHWDEHSSQTWFDDPWSYKWFGKEYTSPHVSQSQRVMPQPCYHTGSSNVAPNHSQWAKKVIAAAHIYPIYS